MGAKEETSWGRGGNTEKDLIGLKGVVCEADGYRVAEASITLCFISRY